MNPAAYCIASLLPALGLLALLSALVGVAS